MSNLKDFVKTLGRKSVTYFVQAWDREVNIKVWSGKDRATISTWYLENKDKPERMAEFNARVVVQSLVDADAKPCFAPADLPTVMEIDATVLDLLAAECLRVNGFGQEGTTEKN